MQHYNMDTESTEWKNRVRGILGMKLIPQPKAFKTLKLLELSDNDGPQTKMAKTFVNGVTQALTELKKENKAELDLKEFREAVKRHKESFR